MSDVGGVLGMSESAGVPEECRRRVSEVSRDGSVGNSSQTDGFLRSVTERGALRVGRSSVSAEDRCAGFGGTHPAGQENPLQLCYVTTNGQQPRPKCHTHSQRPSLVNFFNSNCYLLVVGCLSCPQPFQVICFRWLVA